MVNLLSPTATALEMRIWRESMNSQLAAASLCVCVIAQIIFYAFPRLRVFPRSLLSWLNIYNILFLIYVIIKWSKYSVLHDEWVVNLKPNSIICHAGLVIDNISLIGPAACTTLLCFTLFLLMVLRKDIENNNRWFYGYLAFAILYPVIISFSAGFVNTKASLNVCIIKSASVTLAIRSTYIILCLVQVILLAVTFVYAKRALSATRSITPNSIPAKFLFVRFLLTYLAQTVNIFPGQLYQVLIPYFPEVAANAIFGRFVVVSHSLGPMLDAMVMIGANADFVNWVKVQYSKFQGRYFGKELSPSPSTAHLAPQRPGSVTVTIKQDPGVEMDSLSATDKETSTTSPPKSSDEDDDIDTDALQFNSEVSL